MTRRTIVRDTTPSVTNHAMRPRSGSSAKALLLTILGEFVLPHSGSVWTSTVVDALARLGVAERNARQAVSRLGDQGLLRAVRDGRRARWHLTDEGRLLLTEGAERIYGFGAADDGWDGRWLVVLCSVPEQQRAKRHQLRARLEFSGFGFVQPGVAMSPHLEREPVATAVLKDLDLLVGAMLLRAETADLVSTDDVLERTWNLESLARRYEEFITSFGRRAPRSDEARFAALSELVHQWRRFPFIDPEIPPRLLPDRWPGRRAKDLFDARHATWAPGANAWYEQTEAQAGAGHEPAPPGTAP
jgi:phenylacetic acid degradation operon negative regulatory protein